MNTNSWIADMFKLRTEKDGKVVLSVATGVKADDWSDQEGVLEFQLETGGKNIADVVADRLRRNMARKIKAK